MPPLAGTALFCRQAPPSGGATCFADAVAAWKELSLEKQERLQTLAGRLAGGSGSDAKH